MRKRARIHTPHTSETIELWWGAQSSDAFIGNTLPPLPSLAASGPAPPSLPQSKDQPTSSAKAKKRKRRPPKPAPPRPRSLLALMNSNISTQRRIRRTHAKFVAISATAAAANNVGGEEGEGGDVTTTGPQAGLTGDVDADDAEVGTVDERPGPVPRPSQKSVSEELFDVKPDIGEQAAEKCIQWVNRKILEHVGFQGTFCFLNRMSHRHRDSYTQGHHSWRWMSFQGSQWSTCQMLGGHSASISTSIPI